MVHRPFLWETNVNLLQVKQYIDRIYGRYSDDRLEAVNVVIPIETVGRVGGTSSIPIKTMIKGFDWDNNKLLLYPETDLMLADTDTLSKLREECEQMGWTAFEIGNLKRENKRLRKMIAELEAKLQ